MRWLTCLALALCWPAMAADDPVQKVVYGGRVFGNDPLPVPDKGYLFFLNHTAGISLYGPDGMRKFDTVLQAPDGQTPSAMSAAIDTDGTIVASAAVTASSGYGGALVFLDAAGKQTRFVLTGRYMPAHICFDEKHTIWAFGWQRDEIRNDTEDHEDYPVARHYSRDGKELGAFLPRSLFPGKLSPFPAIGGLWHVRAAGDRIGALARESQDRHAPEWLELDLDGKLIGRWKLGARIPHGGMAYTADGRLFAKTWDEKSRTPRLLVFDRVTSGWLAADPAIAAASAPGLLLGADGNDLVFSEQGGLKLSWVRLGP